MRWEGDEDEEMYYGHMEWDGRRVIPTACVHATLNSKMEICLWYLHLGTYAQMVRWRRLYLGVGHTRQS